ncbi:MAG: hypothetical protein CVU06_11480 [Bacteroidetes bacterium HGW-Bacteroidetes-22]|nr:MAG: hypothetical protein CVU06_11480 [Bacteroidetes bacterium HGW-Bacteroidetes-22]
MPILITISTQRNNKLNSGKYYCVNRFNNSSPLPESGFVNFIPLTGRCIHQTGSSNTNVRESIQLHEAGRKCGYTSGITSEEKTDAALHHQNRCRANDLQCFTARQLNRIGVHDNSMISAKKEFITQKPAK